MPEWEKGVSKLVKFKSIEQSRAGLDWKLIDSTFASFAWDWYLVVAAQHEN